MTIDELRSKVPKKFLPWVDLYGPIFLSMTAVELKAWVDMIIRGRVFEAYGAVLARLTNSALLNEWTALLQEWQSANEKNAARIKLQEQALFAVVKILLVIALTAVGL